MSCSLRSQINQKFIPPEKTTCQLIKKSATAENELKVKSLRIKTIKRRTEVAAVAQLENKRVTYYP